MESRSDFLIRSPEKIISKLSILLKNKNLLTVGLGDRGPTFVTTVLEINKNANTFICDSCEEALAAQALSSPKLWFTTEHLGATVAFDITQLNQTKYEGKPAFLASIPTALHWLEQREFYRVKTPVPTASYCQISAQGQETISLKLYDISLRGFSMLNAADDISELLVPGTQFEKCKLVLENKQEVGISFEIRSKFIINPNNLNKTEKIGCKFTQITPAFENTIHSYMMEIEREILRKRSELGGSSRR